MPLNARAVAILKLPGVFPRVPLLDAHEGPRDEQAKFAFFLPKGRKLKPTFCILRAAVGDSSQSGAGSLN